MHGLFWKIFLSFWFSLILFAGASLVAASLLVEHARTEDETEDPRARLRTYLDEARHVAEKEGVKGLTTWLQKLDRREVIPIFLIDAQGDDLLNRPVSQYLAERVERGERRASRDDRPSRDFRRGLVRVPDGNEYRLVPDFRAVTLNRVLSRPRVIAIPLIVATIVSGFVCFLLARYLTLPIQRLSRATKQLASGQLTMRVTPTMSGRRDEVAELARDFDHMAESLESLIGTQRQLLRDVSHELRSPLARLQVALGLARRRGPDQPHPELDRIELEAERLGELIAQLLSLARLEAGTELSHTDRVDLAALVTEVAESAHFELSASNRRVELITCMPAFVEGDAGLLQSALENMVRNAAKYTAENTAVELSLELDDRRADWLMVQVRDHGPGVPEDMLPKLFDPFVRVDDARDRASGGYGLGLAIAKRAIQLHGGEISASNDIEGGLTVRMRLPTDPVHPTKACTG